MSWLSSGETVEGGRHLQVPSSTCGVQITFIFSSALRGKTRDRVGPSNSASNVPTINIAKCPCGTIFLTARMGKWRKGHLLSIHLSNFPSSDSTSMLQALSHLRPSSSQRTCQRNQKRRCGLLLETDRHRHPVSGLTGRVYRG